MAMLASCCRAGRCVSASHIYSAGPSNLSRACLSTSTPVLNGKPLPVTDWSKPAGSSSSGSRPPRNDRGPKSPRATTRDGQRSSGDGQRPTREGQRPTGEGHRSPRDSQRPTRGPSYGMMPRNLNGTHSSRTPSIRSGNTPQSGPVDLASQLQKWNVSAAPVRRNNQEDGGDESARRPVSERFNNDEQPELDTRHGRRLKPGEKGLSRSFDAVRKASGGGDFSLDRGHARHGTKKGKEREFGNDRSTRLDLTKKAEKPKRAQKAKETEKEVYVPSTVTVSRLADIFGVKIFNLQTRMMRLGMEEDQRRPDYFLTSEDACNIALEYGFNPVVDDEKSFDILPEADPSTNEDQPLRPPVVAIMGHVDHGKTTLLDSLRHTSVAAGEAGGITQHIGAFSVPLSSLVATSQTTSDSSITFLDTPGHAAFTAMRARGASVTDIVVLVVAADDGVMPQTKEVLNLVKSENDRVGLVVAINKCDKPGLDFTKVKSALGAEGILLEEDGGDVPSVKVSGLAKMGLDSLVETLSTIAEVRDLRGRQDGQVQGYVLESRVDRGRGNVATVLVTRGTLQAGSVIVAGNTWAKVRQMQDSLSRPIKTAPPGTPISITGWKELPSAGDQLLEAKDEDLAKKAVTNRIREIERKKMMADVEIINAKRKEERLRAEKEAADEEAIIAAGGTLTQAHMAERLAAAEAARVLERDAFKELRLIIKGDVSGTVEAVVGSLEGIGNKEAGVKIIHTGVGEVGESDVSMAEASQATVIGFSVNCSRSIQNQAKDMNVPLHLESVIYRLIETVRSKVAALLPPKIESRVVGEATVQQLFPVKVKKGTVMVAGCKVSNGIINKAEKVRILRSAGEGKEREVVYEGTIETLRHLKKEVGEVRKGTECGISFDEFADVKEGDEVVSFTTFEVPREL